VAVVCSCHVQRMQIKSQHKYTISELRRAVLLAIPNIQGYHTTEKTRSVLGLLESETECTGILRSFGKRLQMDTM